jgi:hypothetical protein
MTLSALNRPWAVDRANEAGYDIDDKPPPAAARLIPKILKKQQHLRSLLGFEGVDIVSAELDNTLFRFVRDGGPPERPLIVMDLGYAEHLHKSLTTSAGDDPALGREDLPGFLQRVLIDANGYAFLSQTDIDWDEDELADIASQFISVVEDDGPQAGVDYLRRSMAGMGGKTPHDWAPEQSEMRKKYEQALSDAEEMMEGSDLEPTSALKQAASDLGIPWGEEMGKFVKWAHRKLFNR